MKIQVTVKPNVKREGVEKLPDGSYRVSVNAPPQEGRANKAVIELLAKFFKIPKSSITILRGQRGRKKLIEVLSL